MKKITLAIAFAGVLIGLAACGSNNESSDTSMSTENITSSTVDASESSQAVSTEVSIFTGVLSEDATMSDDGAIRVPLKEISAESDPEAILSMMENDGVILNVQAEKLADGVTWETLKANDKVRFTITGLPIMTMSIPPQIPGNAITVVEKVVE